MRIIKLATSLLFLMLIMAASSCSVSGTDTSPPYEFQDCDECPNMVMLPAGTFLMGTAVEDRLIDPRTGKPATNDAPQHLVNIHTPFAIGKFEVTVAEFQAFVTETAYVTIDRCMAFSKKDSFEISRDINWKNPGFAQTDNAPVGCVSFFDAEAYANWLSSKTGQNYRLPTEAEWEYAARAGATTSYHWGSDEADACKYANVRSKGAPAISKRQADSDEADGFPCDDGEQQSSSAGRYRANEFGLHDMQGNVWEWAADCNHKSYADAPTDGSAWLDSKACRFGVIRGGSYLNRVERSSATVRAGRPRSGGATNMGFRIARGGNKASDATPATMLTTYSARADTGPGALLFADNCAACHESPEGFEGLYGKDQESLVKTIRDGGNNIMSMPAFNDRLTDAEIETVTTYLRQVNGWQ
jgi:formylglycine-generating enzyme required for sulfatase activity